MMKTKHKRRKALVCGLALAGLVAVSLVGYAGNLEPSAPPGPTMKTLDEVEPRIPLSQKTTPGDAFYLYVITEPGSYYLTEDTTATRTGIKVGADNVTIDLMGYNLIGTPSELLGFGVYMSGRSNVEIRNGTVRDFPKLGIYETSKETGKQHRVINVRAISNGSDGIHLRGYGHLVKDCTAADNGNNGIWLQQVHGLTIYITGSSTVTGCAAHNNDANGIAVGYACVVTGNNARDNQGHGIQADDGSVVTHNAAFNNDDNGIHVEGACTLIGNTAAHNSYGIYIKGNCLVDQNTAVANGTDGIYDFYGVSTVTAANHDP
ncbi:MAG: right-handed parallel beta-helix repeat-containing protein [Planctomycetota bacterium]|jgi:parallel beta-helix repeat protein